MNKTTRLNPQIFFYIQSRLFIPKRTWEGTTSSSPEAKALLPGYFLAKSGLTEADILLNRLPSVQAGTLAAFSNGLSLDLMRMVQRDAALGPPVVSFIFNFLELTFPDCLAAVAAAKLVECLQENLNYVEDAPPGEAATFLQAPLQLPRDVIEMAAVLGEIIFSTSRYRRYRTGTQAV